MNLPHAVVLLEALILKPNMVLPGLACAVQDGIDLVAEATVRCCAVPAAVAGIAFLSGGQSGELASARLNAMNSGVAPAAAAMALVFSFARAIQQPALEIWRGEAANSRRAARLVHRAPCNLAALRGAYDAAMEREPALRLAS